MVFLFLPFLVLVFLFNFWVSYNLTSLEPDKRVYIPPPQQMPHLTWGYNEIIADSFWLRWVQDLDVCGKETLSRREFDGSLGYVREQKEKATELQADEGLMQRLEDHVDTDVCVMGWSFRLLDTVTLLAPQFRTPYTVGGPALSVFANDHLGAKVIFDRGIAQYPNDWKILYRAAYHYLYELKDLKSAGDLMSRAGDMGAPPWVKSLAARLYTRSGQLLLGIVTLETYAKQLKEGDYKDQVLQRVKDLRKSLESQSNN